MSSLDVFLKGIADAIREKKETTELINAQNFASEILSIESGGGGLIEVTELPEVGEEDVVYKLLGSAKGTTVPSGNLSTIYFNNSLTTEEVVSIIESANLSYSTDGLIPNSYLIAQCLMIIKNENDYGIMYIHSDGEGSADFNNIEVIFSSANTEGVDFVGWNPNFKNPIEYEYDNTIESNDTAISKNEALKDLVSSTPFEASAEYFVYEKLPPLAVPTSGTISNVYINPIYTAEEMQAIIEKYATVELQGLLGYPIAIDMDTGAILGMLYNDSGFYVIGVVTYDGSSFTLDQNKLLYHTSVTDGTPVFNTEGLSLNWTTMSNADGIPIGSKNSEISNLISITPDFSGTGQFKKISGANIVSKGGTVVPNSGYVEKVYFNQNISSDEVNEILLQLNLVLTPIHTSPLYPLILSSDGSKGIFAMYNTNDSNVTNFYIIYQNSVTNEVLYLYLSDSNSHISNDVFIEDEIEFGSEVIGESQNLIIGGQNDILKDFVSSTPSFGDDKVIKELSGDYEAVDLEVTENTTVDVGAMLDEGKMPMSVTVNVGGGEDMLQARVDATNSCKNLFYQYTGDNVDYIRNLNTSNVTDMQNMFYGCSNLQTIPQLDTSNVTDIRSMFYGCSNLQTIPQLNTSRVDTYYRIFMDCKNLQTIPQLDTKNAFNMQNMFYGCSNLQTIPQLDTSNVTSMSGMFCGCSKITEIPLIDTSKSKEFGEFVKDCSNLQTIPQLNMVNANSSQVYSMFNNCSQLTNLTLLNIKVNLAIGSGTTWGHLLTLESLINTVKECINVGSARTLTMGTANLEKIASTYVKFTDSSVTTIPRNEKGDVVVCESTDEGAMLIADYMALKGWVLA